MLPTSFYVLGSSYRSRRSLPRFAVFQVASNELLISFNPSSKRYWQETCFIFGVILGSKVSDSFCKTMKLKTLQLTETKHFKARISATLYNTWIMLMWSMCKGRRSAKKNRKVPYFGPFKVIKDFTILIAYTQIYRPTIFYFNVNAPSEPYWAWSLLSSISDRKHVCTDASSVPLKHLMSFGCCTKANLLLVCSSVWMPSIK